MKTGKGLVLVLGSALLVTNWVAVAVDKLPDDFPSNTTIQNYSGQGFRPTIVGTTTIYSGMLGIHPFQIVVPVQFGELTPTFVSSFYPR